MIPKVQGQDKEKALKMHKRGIKLWENIRDDDAKTWFSRANLMAIFNLSDQQLDVIGRRLMQWDPGDWWQMSIKASPKLEALQCKNQTEMWPIPHRHPLRPIHKALNKRWRLLWDKKKWSYEFPHYGALMWNLRKLAEPS